MNRNEFTEFVYETFADEPDNVLANGIIEAADAYVEHEKTQLSKEGATKDATSDLISRMETVEHLRRALDATVPITDYDEGYVDGVEVGISTVSTMPTIQSQSTTGQLDNGARSTAQSTDLIDRQEAIDRFNVIRPVDTKKDEYTKGIDVGIAMCIVAVKDQPTIQPEKAQLFSGGTTSDTISRQAAIDALSLGREILSRVLDDRDVVGVDREKYSYGLKLIESNIEDIKELPPAQPEPQWIPVSERLPEKGGEYLVSVHHTIGAISVFHPEKDTYVDDVAIMKYYGKFPSTVRAWMLLPEAYKPNK